MDHTIENAKQDISPEWLELTRRVRGHANGCLNGGADVQDLANEALRLCDHVDRLHDDIQELLRLTDVDANGDANKAPDERAIDMAAIEQQRETHEMRADPRDILKALLMWRDDPAERVRRGAD